MERKMNYDEIDLHFENLDDGVENGSRVGVIGDFYLEEGEGDYSEERMVIWFKGYGNYMGKSKDRKGNPIPEKVKFDSGKVAPVNESSLIGHEEKIKSLLELLEGAGKGVVYPID